MSRGRKRDGVGYRIHEHFHQLPLLAPFGVVSEDHKTVRALGGWDTKVTVTTPRDIGGVVAEVV